MPDIVLITTTINVPTVLKLYRRYAPSDVVFIIAGDLKSPHEAIMELMADIQPALYLPPDYQRRYRCSEHIGWNCIQRRNIALLEAIRMRPKVIVTVDDDNIPLSETYFSDMLYRITMPQSGLMATGMRWFNVGDLGAKRFCHRGFHSGTYLAERNTALSAATDKRIGIWEGLWMGDLDVSAWSRPTYGERTFTPPIHLDVLVDTGVFAPLNTQNTAIAYDAAALIGPLPQVGRYDDIWASYIAERIMWENDLYVGYGRPLCWQERNPHSIQGDRGMEKFGEMHTEHFCEFLRGLSIPDGDMVGQLAFVYKKLALLDYMPQQTLDFCEAWLRDLEEVL